MSVVGFRCQKDAIAYVVLGGTVGDPEVIDHGVTRMPKGDRSEQLVWLRQEVQEILDRVAPTAVSFKPAETVARTKDIGRAEAEGVLQEAVRSRGLNPVRRLKTQIKSDLGFSKPARYLETLLDGKLEALPENRREAALVALAALTDA